MSDNKYDRIRLVDTTKHLSIGERSEPTVLRKLLVGSCGDPSCTLCAEFCGESGTAAIERVQRAMIVREIRELQQFGAEHPEHATEVYCRTNELLDKLGSAE